MTYVSFLKLLLTLALVQLLSACSEDKVPDTQPSSKSKPPLRVIIPSHSQNLEFLPRSGQAGSDEYELLKRFAETANMDIKKVLVENYDQLIPALEAGKGDIIISNLTVTDKRKQRVKFTTPVAYVHEQLVGRHGDTPKTAHELEGRKVAVHRSDAYFDTITAVKKRRFQPPFEINEVNENISTDAILNGVIEGVYDLAVVDSNQLTARADRDRLEVGFDIGSVRPIAWAVAKENTLLLSQLNDFLSQHHLTTQGEFIATADLNKMKDHGVLRVLTRNNSTTYYLWRGDLYGFEYELAKRFAEQHKLRLEMVVPPSRDLLIPWLKQGKGDLIAASLTISDERRSQSVDFSRPYNTISEIVVSRSDDSIEGIEQLEGRRIVVRPSSSYWQTLTALQQQGRQFELLPAAEELETEELIAQVASGEIDLTVADSHILDIELTWRDDVKGAFSIGERQHGWVVRKENPALLKAVNQFHKKEYRGLFYNITYDKYFKNTKRIISHAEQRSDKVDGGVISPYDELVKQHAEHYGFDWRLITSQMFQESRFNPKAKSWVGALGLLQVLPRTAKEFGIKDLHTPDTGILAGVQYLNWLRKRFEPSLDIGERTWLALAAYNAGIGHVRDARRLAKQKGWNPDIWFKNVEKAMLLLAKKEYAKKAKHGYARGHEPVNYVRQIRDRYQAYLDLTAGQTLARSD